MGCAGVARGLWLTGLLGCAGGADDGDPAPGWSPQLTGPHAVGVQVTVGGIDGAADDLVVTTWYPTTSTPQEVPLSALADPAQAARLDALVDAAPAGCATATVVVAVDGARVAGELPTVVLSHCHTCLPASYATLAAHLASHGWVVVAPEHPGDTLWDRLDEDVVRLDNAALDDRVAVLDAVTSSVLADAGAAPVAVAGHSFGSITMARVLALHAELRAGVGLLAPPDNPLFDAPDVGDLGRPLMLALATEDQSITELGNVLIRDDLARAGVPAYGVELVDAGHWSVNDTLAVIPDFDKGCGTGEREGDGTAFTWADPVATRASIATEVLAFLEATVGDRDEAWAWIRQGDGAGIVRALRE